jgi:hypothetical protein
MAHVSIEITFGCCGNVSRYLNPGEEPFYPGDEQMMKCDKCNKTDFPDAFRRMALEDEKVHCPSCGKQTRQTLDYFDDWSGNIETTCNECGQKNAHEAI